jgi:hypothetical protein
VITRACVSGTSEVAQQGRRVWGIRPEAARDGNNERLLSFLSYRPSIRFDWTKSKTKSKTTRIRCPLEKSSQDPNISLANGNRPISHSSLTSSANDFGRLTPRKRSFEW